LGGERKGKEEKGGLKGKDCNNWGNLRKLKERYAGDRGWDENASRRRVFLFGKMLGFICTGPDPIQVFFVFLLFYDPFNGKIKKVEKLHCVATFLIWIYVY
jgi:hypothetical protein